LEDRQDAEHIDYGQQSLVHRSQDRNNDPDKHRQDEDKIIPAMNQPIDAASL
jgi:hypothetical protein